MKIESNHVCAYIPFYHVFSKTWELSAQFFIAENALYFIYISVIFHSVIRPQHLKPSPYGYTERKFPFTRQKVEKRQK